MIMFKDVVLLLLNAIVVCFLPVDVNLIVDDVTLAVETLMMPKDKCC